MRNKFSIISLVACMIGFSSVVFTQEAPKAPEAPKAKEEITKPKDVKLPKVTHFQRFSSPMFKMPERVKNAFDLFKFADELQLTDEQLIQLRAYYKKHFSEEAKKKNPPAGQTIADFYKMSEPELNKFIDDESTRVKKEIIFNLQKIIDIKKILKPEQLEKIKLESEKEAEKRRKKIEEKLMKKGPFTPMGPQHGMMNQPKFPMRPMCPPMGMMRPHVSMPQQGMMNPQMPPMCPPPMGMMMPMCQPMCPQPCGMNQPMPMCPQPMGMMNQPMPPQKPHMRHHHGMMNQPMQPMCPPPMGKMNPQMSPKCPPMGPQQGMMNQAMPMCPPPMGMMNNKMLPKNRPFPPRPLYGKDPKMDSPIGGFFEKIFGCKKSPDSDIMKKEPKGLEK